MKKNHGEVHSHDAFTNFFIGLDYSYFLYLASVEIKVM
jgi:hypothetical protein